MTAGCYTAFCAGVAGRQLRSWLAQVDGGPVLDLTPGAPCVRVIPQAVSLSMQPPGHGGIRVRGDHELLSCIRPGSVAGVVAESGALARCVVTEETLSQTFRVLRPGGRLLICVESLRRGLAELAAAGRWAELADAPQADVVLIPAEDGTVRRCFTPEELGSSISDAGFALEWIRPRTVLPPEAVERAVLADPAALPTLIEAELRLAQEWDSREIAGSWLLASATRPG